MIYFIMFFFTFLCLELATKAKSKYIKKFFNFVGILIPCLLAGLRSFEVGTDVSIYLKPMFLNAINCSSYNDFLNSMVRYDMVSSYEIGFTFLVFIVAKLFSNFQVLLFLIELIIIFPVYKGLKIYFDDDKYIAYGILIYLFLGYNTSLNIMRQYIAMSIIFLGTCQLLKNDKKIYFLLSIILAFCFHKSSIICIIVLFVYLLYNYKFKKYFVIGGHNIFINKFLLLTSLIICFFLIINNNIFVGILSSLKLDYYIRYVNGKVSFVMISIVKFVPFLILLFVTGFKNFKKDNNYYLLISFAFFDFLFNMFSSFNVFSSRIALYFSIFYIISFTNILRFEEKKFKKLFILLFTITFIISYWYFYSIYSNGGETFPYLYFF